MGFSLRIKRVWSPTYSIQNLVPFAPEYREFARPAPSQVRVTPSEIPCLQHPSHINTAQLVRASPMELSVLTSAPQRNHGPLTRAVIDLIKMAVAAHGILPADQASMVANL